MRRFVQTFTVVAVLVAPAVANATVARQVATATGTVQSSTAFIRSELMIDASPAQPTAVAASRDLCEGHRSPAVMCGPGNGRRTRGGGSKVSHLGWPAVTGILWIVRPEADIGQTDNGTELNDELLGLHGNDTLRGGFGHDILWGDQLPVGNNEWQHDVMDGGAGNDWIYSSHGRNDIQGGAGNDHIWGHFGRGTIDCGSGWDVVHTKHRSTYRLRHCERHLDH
jgi:RTX calcium-binding nonapeptide repeat (4 copies)